MTRTPQAQLEYAAKYQSDLDRVRLWINKEKKQTWQQAAKHAGLSLTAFVTDAVDDYIGRHVDDAADS